MNNQFDFAIRKVPRVNKFLACYKRSWGGSWSHYRNHGSPRYFDSWDDAYQFIIDKCGGNAVLALTHFQGMLPANLVFSRMDLTQKGHSHENV